MKPQIEPADLMQRIRREARRQESIAFPSTASSSADAGDGTMPPVPVLPAVQPGGFSCESLLAHVGNMLDRARGKTTVRKSIPKFLRPLSRNQGGYNDIVLEALERLRESSRLLLSENAQLRQHLQRQTEWMQAVERRFARVETRLDEQENQESAEQGTPDIEDFTPKS